MLLLNRQTGKKTDGKIELPCRGTYYFSECVID